MTELFKDLPSALENTIEIAKRCNVKVKQALIICRLIPSLKAWTKPSFPQNLWAWAEERLVHLGIGADKRQTYDDRLTFELDIIIQMGFPGYF